jgi:pilus retraction protein PilT
VAFDLDAALAQAHQLGASDLHVKVPSVPRVRVGGILRPLPGADPIKPAETEQLIRQVLPSDIKREQFEARGAVEVSYYTHNARFRASVFRQRGSVALVFRLITEAPTPEGLGIPEVVLNWSHQTQGLVIVGGPTGSGKSTTTAVVVRLINEQRPCHIITIEDPIEYLHPDLEALVSQREIGNDSPSFHDALRSALRQDPDVILVGEVRDAETAQIAASASVTGHLVLSTLHTTSAAATAMRLADMGVEPYLVASALTCIVSQRLARRLCENCAKEMHDADTSVLTELGATPDMLDGAVIRTPVGCNACRYTGYRGRMPVYEIMPVTEEIRRLIVERAPAADIERVAVEQGMDTLRTAALRRVATGQLSIEEMLRVSS